MKKSAKIFLFVVLLLFVGYFIYIKYLKQPATTSTPYVPVSNSAPTYTTPTATNTTPVLAPQPVSSTPIKTSSSMTRDQIIEKYGSDAGMVFDCVTKYPNGGVGGSDYAGLHSCIVTGPSRYCWEQGLQSPPSCGGCGVNPTDCQRMSTLYTTLRNDGIIPKYY